MSAPSAKGQKTTPRLPRNHEIAPGISRFSAGRLYHKRGLWIKLQKPNPAKPKAQKVENVVTKPIGGAKNGTERKVHAKKTGRFLPQVHEVLKEHTRKSKTQALRSSITPGTILIILAGRHRGKRVVFLKQLDSGLLLVTGPLRYNSTPIRRIAQAFVIATKTKVDISSVNVPEHLNDIYFKRTDEKKDKKKTEGDIFVEKQDYKVSDERKKDQKAVDAAIIAAIKKHPDAAFLKSYLATKFSIGKGQHPHKLVF